ncbi:pentapeptide repeat-containing protein [Streptomyces leeuwenhoekii]|uniref:pentapeptide repeat-containing protein n=1 Tax=Streptomyces leeuwenhoekii TaxID=1437453 RepID=UPI0036B14572
MTANRRPGSAPGNRELQLWKVGWALTVVFVSAVLVAGGIFSSLVYLLDFQELDSTAKLDAKTLFDLVKLSFGVVAGAGALVALVVAYRRQRVDEAGAHREATRLHTERFSQAVDKLGSDSPAVRLGGVHALAGLADDAPDDNLRQTCIDVLCAYLQLPFTPDPGDDPAHQAEHHHYLALRKVRHTIMRLICDHYRRPRGTRGSWQGCDLDFTGVIIDGRMDFSGAEFSGGTVSFDGAEFSGGSVIFERATFSGSSVSFVGAVFSQGSLVDFDYAVFSDGRVGFDGAKFSGGTVAFRDATFSGGLVIFDYAAFCAGYVPFDRATVAGPGGVSFSSTAFSGSAVSFRGVAFAGGEAHFERAKFSKKSVGFVDVTFSGGWVSFCDAVFSDGAVTFKDATFSGGQVSMSFMGATGAAPSGLLAAAGTPPSSEVALPADWLPSPPY